MKSCSRGKGKKILSFSHNSLWGYYGENGWVYPGKKKGLSLSPEGGDQRYLASQKKKLKVEKDRGRRLRKRKKKKRGSFYLEYVGKGSA